MPLNWLTIVTTTNRRSHQGGHHPAPWRRTTGRKHERRRGAASVGRDDGAESGNIDSPSPSIVEYTNDRGQGAAYSQGGPVKAEGQTHGVKREAPAMAEEGCLTRYKTRRLDNGGVEIDLT
jgi:hypothetical protein